MTEARGPAGGGRGAKREAYLKVMIIDPNPGHRDRLKDLVRHVDFVDSVSDRGSPHGLLELLAKNPVHVLLIDRNPGAGNAFDIVKVVRGKPSGAHMGFVLMGEDLDAEVQREAAGAGISALLPRPYDLRSVEAVLNKAAAAAASAVASAAAPKAQAAASERARDPLRDTLEKLRQVSLFAKFSDPELVRLLKICRTRRFKQGSYVFREGEPGYSLFVLVAGRLDIRTTVDGTEHVLVEMNSGDCFGEMAIIDAEPRSADAVAATDCTVIEVNESVVNNNEDILSLKLVRQIAILLAKKLRKQSQALVR